jgi:hypothetical protein
MRDGRAKKCKLVEHKDGRAKAKQKMRGGRAKKGKLVEQKLNKNKSTFCKTSKNKST